MNTQELRNKIDSILGNSMRVLLPSYWWKRLFHHVADALDSKGQGVSIVESEKDLKKLDVPEGSLASVVGEAEWKSFDECYQPPEGAGDEFIPLCTRIPVVNVSDAPITIVGSPLILLADITNISSDVIKIMYLGIDNIGVVAVILSNATGSQHIEGIYALRGTDSTVVNKAALNQLNAILSSGRYLFVGYEPNTNGPETEEEQIAALNSIFSWTESVGGVYHKGVSWDRLAMANEIPNVSGTGGSTNITVDTAMSSTSTNPVQNKAITKYVDDLTMSIGNSNYLYKTPRDIRLNVGKGYIADSSNNPMPAGDVVITSLNGSSSYRDRILVFFGATSLTIPSDVLWENGVVPVIDPEATYVLNIKSTEGLGGNAIHMASLKAFSAKELGTPAIKELVFHVGVNPIDETQKARNAESYSTYMSNNGKALVVIEDTTIGALLRATSIPIGDKILVGVMDTQIPEDLSQPGSVQVVWYTVTADGSMSMATNSDLDV